MPEARKKVRPATRRRTERGRPAARRARARDLSLPHDPVLFGHDPTRGLVAVEESAPGRMAVWRRIGAKLEREEEDYAPFLLLADAALLAGFEPPPETESLSGPGFFRHLVRAPSMRELNRLARHLRSTSGKTSSAAGVPYLYQKDVVHLYLTETGRTLFKGLDPEDVPTLALDIETWCEPGFEFSNPDRPGDRVISIALADNRGREEVIRGHVLEEAAMLRRLNEVVLDWDPDVILGHNLMKFDLPYIARRAALEGVLLPWGRDGSPPRSHPSRLTVAERVFDYPKWEVFGRHVIDTYILTLFYDVATRELETLTLKDVARALGVSPPGRTYLDAARLGWHFEHEPDVLYRYNLDDARETLGVGRALGGISFIECQIFPYSFQNTVVRGMATKVNALITREYVHRRAALPEAPGRAAELEGGATDIFEVGVVRDVYHVDIKSLYPSIILSSGVRPAGDHLGVFLPLLKLLRSFRLKAKEMAAGAGRGRAAARLDALQMAFKVLINSFYGLLASGLHEFSDLEAAARVTAEGRRLIGAMMDRLRDLGCRLVEVDTDGIFFFATGRPFTAKEGEKMTREVASVLPRGIVPELDGLYPAMFSHKIKNYALLDNEGRLIIKGSGLKSRGLEPYLRGYLREAILLALSGRPEEVEALYAATREKISSHALPVQELAKTETLVDSLQTYRDKTGGGRRNLSAAYELALASGRDYRPGDQISWYVTGSSPKAVAYRHARRLEEWDPRRPDENAPYYMAKLEELDRRFRPSLCRVVR